MIYTDKYIKQLEDILATTNTNEQKLAEITQVFYQVENESYSDGWNLGFAEGKLQQ